MNIKQPTLLVSGNHDVIVYTVNSLHLVQNIPNAKLILYPDATTVRGIRITRTSSSKPISFLTGYGATAETSVRVKSTSQ